MKNKKTNNLKKINQLKPSWLLFNVSSGLVYYPSLKNLKTKKARKEIVYLRYLIRNLIKRPKQISLSYYSPQLKKFRYANQEIKTNLKGNLIIWGEQIR